MSNWRNKLKERTSSLFRSEGSFAYAEGYDGITETGETAQVQTPPATVNAQIMVVDHIGREDATRIADYIGGSRMVVMDLADTPQGDRLRILDFLSGYMYSQGGKISKINSHAYIAVPGHVDLYGASEEDESLYSQLTNAFGGGTDSGAKA